MNTMAKRFLAVLGLVLALALPAMRANAAGLEALLPLLVDLPGWEAEPADGADASFEGQRACTAYRSYESAGRRFEVNLLIGSQAMGSWMPDYREGFKVETPEGGMQVRKIAGFLVMSMFDQEDQAGGIVVLLQDPGDDPDALGAVLAVDFEGLAQEEALKLAQRFPWPKLKEQAGRLK